MKNKNTILTIVLVVGIIMVVTGIIISNLANNTDVPKPLPGEIEEEQKEEVKEPDEQLHEQQPQTYDDVYDMAVSLYEYDGRTVQVEEKEDKFIIYVKNSNGDIINTFNMDKKTGVVSEEPISSSIVATN
jgi:hypothetical protein